MKLKKISEEIMMENFPNWAKDTNLDSKMGEWGERKEKIEISSSLAVWVKTGVKKYHLNLSNQTVKKQKAL